MFNSKVLVIRIINYYIKEKRTSIMEIFIYKTYEQWYKDSPIEVLNGNIYSLENGLIAVDTIIEVKSYRQVFSPSNNFAVVQKLDYGFLGYSKEINIYKDSASWQKSKPDISINGEVHEMESSDSYLVFTSEEGYKQYISLNGIYSVVYER